MPFLLIRNDITKVSADAIVNPANRQLLEGSGTSRAIYLAAGEKLLTEACRKIGHCDPGQAVATEAFHLSARYIIHAVGPVWKDGHHGEDRLLYSAYSASMKLAVSLRLESIAFPLLSSGNYGYPKDQALRVAISAISDFLIDHELTVYMVLYDRKALAVSRKLFTSVTEYIDDHYVDANDETFSRNRILGSRFRFSKPDVQETGFCFEDTIALPSSPVQQSDCQNEPTYQLHLPLPSSPVRQSARSLDHLMEHMGETFSQMLLRLIDERGLKDSQVYKKANVDRRHFSKIRNDIHYAPNKKTVLAFAIALELSMDETKDLLMRAGFAFSMCSKFDVIICYFIEHRNYDIFEINEMLFSYDQPLLGS